VAPPVVTPPRANRRSVSIGGDLAVPPIGFGAMRVTGRGIWGEPPDPGAARALLRTAAELGVGLIDTADSYGPEVSERLIAEALHPYPEQVVIATKGGLVRDGPWRWHADGRPAHLRAACEASLRRLRLERIDLYQLHTVDHAVPLAESVGALAELQRQGKIRHIGLSNVDVGQLARARSIVPIVSVQNRYSLLDRGSEDVLAVCEREGLAFLPWFPLGKGSLARPDRRLDRIARAHGATRAQVALAWLLHRSPAIVPIPGTSSEQHLRENVAAAELVLDDAELAALANHTPTGAESLRRAVRRLGRSTLARLSALR
jgi:pyridoxine 4-dehydrogenase